MNIKTYESITITPSSGITITRKHTKFIPSLGLCYFSALFNTDSTQNKIVNLGSVGSKYCPKETEVTIFCADNTYDIGCNGVITAAGTINFYRNHTSTMNAVRAFAIWFV